MSFCAVKEPPWCGSINNINKTPAVRAISYQEEESVLLSACEVSEARPPRTDLQCIEATLIFYYCRHIKINNLSAV